MAKALETLIDVKKSEQTAVNVRISEIHQKLNKLSERLENEVNELKSNQEEELKRLKEKQEEELKRLKDSHTIQVAEISEKAKAEVSDLREQDQHISGVINTLSNGEFFLKTTPDEAMEFIRQEFVKENPDMESRMGKILLNCINEQLEAKKQKEERRENTNDIYMSPKIEPIPEKEIIEIPSQESTLFEKSIKNELFNSSKEGIERSKRLL